MQDLPAWALVNEYCGVWDAASAVAQRIDEDPLGAIRCDKVIEIQLTTPGACTTASKGKVRSSGTPLDYNSGPCYHHRLHCHEVPGHHLL